MRITLISRDFVPINTRYSSRAYNFANMLKFIGHEIFVVSGAPQKEFEGLTVPVTPDIYENELNPRHYHALGWGVRRWLRELFVWPDPFSKWSHEVTVKLSEMKDFKTDLILVLAHPMSALCIGVSLKKQTNAKLVADFSDNVLTPPPRPESGTIFRKIGEKMLLSKMLKDADYIIAASNNIKNEISNYTKNEISVIDDIPEKNEDGFKLTPEDGIHLLYSGQFKLRHVANDIRFLLNEFEIAGNNNPNIYLHICGNLSHHEQNLIENSAICDRIGFYGALPPRELSAMINSVDGLVMLCSDDNNLESRKLYEYEKTDKPIFVIGGGKIKTNNVSATGLGEVVETIYKAKSFNKPKIKQKNKHGELMAALGGLIDK